MNMHAESINPSTGTLIASYPWFTEARVESCLNDAAVAFTDHRKTSFSERAGKMRRIADLLEANASEYGILMVSEMGKPLSQAVGEANKCAWVCRYYADHAEQMLQVEEVDTDASRAYVTYQALGPILAVMPWNYPFWQVIRFASPAIMAGNVALLKHAPNVSGCALAIESLFQEAGFEKGVFQTLIVDTEAVKEIVADDRVRATTLTGSSRAGRVVGALSGGALKPSVMELGGSDPFIVLEDAPLDKAVSTAVASRMQNNGQSCIAAKRFIVEEGIADEFEDRLVESVKQLAVGDPMKPDTDIGPLARADLRDALDDQVRRSVREGAVLAVGGRPLEGPGFYYAPTVLTDVREGSVAFEEELFGPVAAVIRAKNPDDAVRLANGTPYGLGGAVFTSDLELGERIAGELEVGCAFVNAMVKSDPRLPFGGTKASGYGRELSYHGLKEFVNTKTVWIG